MAEIENATSVAQLCHRHGTPVPTAWHKHAKPVALVKNQDFSSTARV